MPRCLFLINLALFISLTVSSKWNISIEINPECKKGCEGFNVVYIKAQNKTCSFHYLIDASDLFRLPSLLAVHSADPNPLVSFNYSTLIKDNTHFVNVGNTTQSYGLGFLGLIEYEYSNLTTNSSQIPNTDSLRRFYYMDNWEWSLLPFNVTNHLKEGEMLEIMYQASGSDTVFKNNGTVIIKFLVGNLDARNEQLPHLRFLGGRSIQAEVILNNLTSTFPHSRFLLQLIPVSNVTLLPEEQYGLDLSFGIFDEVTPSTFETVNLLLAKRRGMAHGSTHTHDLESSPPAFIQSKPICYTAPDDRSLKTSRTASWLTEQASLSTTQHKKFRQSLIAAFYGTRSYPQFQGIRTFQDVLDKGPTVPIGSRLQNVTFDANGDGYYALYNFTVWSLSFGFEDPPAESPSGLVIGMLSLALLFVVIALLIGVAAVFLSRRIGLRRRFDPLLSDSVSA